MHLIILDLGLPKRPGLAILKDIRKGTLFLNQHCPVLILTARNTWQERVKGLKSGANDYLGKPFQFEELLARIEVALRRTQVDVNILTVCLYKLNLETKQLLLGETVFDLTLMEFRLLEIFMQQPNHICIEGAYEATADRR